MPGAFTFAGRSRPKGIVAVEQYLNIHGVRPFPDDDRRENVAFLDVVTDVDLRAEFLTR